MYNVKHNNGVWTMKQIFYIHLKQRWLKQGSFYVIDNQVTKPKLFWAYINSHSERFGQKLKYCLARWNFWPIAITIYNLLCIFISFIYQRNKRTERKQIYNTNQSLTRAMHRKAAKNEINSKYSKLQIVKLYNQNHLQIRLQNWVKESIACYELSSFFLVAKSLACSNLVLWIKCKSFILIFQYQDR